MDYLVRRKQIKDISYKYFDKIFGDILPKVGKNYSYVFVDSTGRGRVGYNKTIHFGRVYLILDEDVDNFMKVIPLSKKDFASLFTGWMNEKFSLGEVNRMTTVPQERLAHINLCVPPYCRSNSY